MLSIFCSPLVPLPLSNKLLKTVSIDDYQISFYHPNFDEQWKQTEVARMLLDCMVVSLTFNEGVDGSSPSRLTFLLSNTVVLTV